MFYHRAAEDTEKEDSLFEELSPYGAILGRRLLFLGNLKVITYLPCQEFIYLAMSWYRTNLLPALFTL